jgi:hypothetical protein
MRKCFRLSEQDLERRRLSIRIAHAIFILRLIEAIRFGPSAGFKGAVAV